MPTYSADIDNQGRVRLPEELVRSLDIKAGETVDFFLARDGQIHLHVVNRSWNALTLKQPAQRPRLSIREMDDMIADAVAEDDERIKQQSRKMERSAAE